MKFLKSIRRELIAGAIVLVLFYLVTPLLRLLDPTAGALDLGWLHFFILIPVGVFAAILTFWLVLNTALKTLDDWIDRGGYKDDFATAGPACRLWIFTAVFVGFMLTFGLIAIAVLS